MDLCSSDTRQGYLNLRTIVTRSKKDNGDDYTDPNCLAESTTKITDLADNTYGWIENRPDETKPVHMEENSTQNLRQEKFPPRWLNTLVLRRWTNHKKYVEQEARHCWEWRRKKDRIFNCVEGTIICWRHRQTDINNYDS